jgi:hypothetical protein
MFAIVSCKLRLWPEQESEFSLSHNSKIHSSSAFLQPALLVLRRRRPALSSPAVCKYLSRSDRHNMTDMRYWQIEKSRGLALVPATAKQSCLSRFSSKTLFLFA